MKNIKQLLFSVIIIAQLTSCGKKQPECSDKEVKETALELSEEILLKKIATTIFIDTHFKEKPNANIMLLADKIGETEFRNILNEQFSKIYKNGYDQESTYSIAYVKALNRYEELAPKIENIRIKNKETELRKCYCEANLNLSNDSSIEINYNVQITEEEETFVELIME